MFGHFLEKEVLAVDQDVAVEGLKYFLVSGFVFGVTLIRFGDVLDPLDDDMNQDWDFLIFKHDISIFLISVWLKDK